MTKLQKADWANSTEVSAEPQTEFSFSLDVTANAFDELRNATPNGSGGI